MSDAKKFVNIHENVLIEWIYNCGNISENYSIWSDIKTQSRNFLSKSNNNNIEYTLFNIDPVIKKYSKIDTEKFNFLKIQDYFTAPLEYDKINIYFPFNYNFDSYVGFLMKIYVYDFINKNIVHFSNYFYDKTDINIEKLMQLNPPFRYGEKEWGKYLTISIPSINNVANDRVITNVSNKPTPNSINYNITQNNIGIGLSSPIFIDISFITTRETTLGTTYYYLGDTFSTSISQTPEYQSLGVTIEESKDWDFFEIYGFYNNSNENLDNFIRDLENNGRRINIEYIVTLYEENIQSGFPTKFLVTENFSQKIEYRPIFKYSNTTAAINVEMNIIDLVDNSIITRQTSIGLTKNLFKYGKKLSRLQIDTLNKPKIYNYRSDNAMSVNSNISAINTYGVTKVPYPLLISNYKILLNASSQTENEDYKPLGTMTLLLTPFDNIIKFKIARQINKDGTPEPYDMSEILNNAKLTLIFKSDNEMIEKDMFHETDDIDIKYGVVVYKILETDMKIIKKLKSKDDNFYLTIVGNNTRTLLYSGKYKIYEDVKFLEEVKSGTLTPSEEKPKDDSIIVDTSVSSSPTNDSSNSGHSSIIKTNKKKNKFYIDDKLHKNSPFKEENIPVRPLYDQTELNYYRNIIVYMKNGISTAEKNIIRAKLKSLGLSIYYNYGDTFVLERVHVSKIKNIEEIGSINNVIKLKLNFGWGSVLPDTPHPVDPIPLVGVPPSKKTTSSSSSSSSR